MFLSCGSLIFWASRFLILRHTSPMLLDDGNGLFAVYFVMYVLSMSAVCCLSLNDRELCPLHPCALMIPLSRSMSFLCMVASSCASKPVSARIVKIVAYFGGDALMILVMFSVVGMSGIFLSHLKYGFFHSIPFVLQYQLYARASLFLDWLHTGEFAIAVFTSSGFLRSAFRLSCFSLREIAMTVFFALPSFLALMRVFIMRSSYFVGCWGRSIASDLWGILVHIRLDWFSIPAWGVGDPGFKSQRPHHFFTNWTRI